VKGGLNHRSLGTPELDLQSLLQWYIAREFFLMYGFMKSKEYKELKI
jgi:hypothetical protein